MPIEKKQKVHPHDSNLIFSMSSWIPHTPQYSPIRIISDTFHSHDQICLMSVCDFIDIFNSSEKLDNSSQRLI